MLVKLEGLPSTIVGLRAVGVLTRSDYEDVFEPLLNDARRHGGRISLLYQLGPDFEGMAPGAVWEDVKIGLCSLRLFDGCAVVSDIPWIHQSARLASFVIPCPVRAFSNIRFGAAVDWLASLPSGRTISHALIPESSVIVVEVDAPLRAQDLDALSMTADAWIESHGALRGLVLHVRRFPGWENLGGFIRHVQFVQDHQRRVRRVALSADSRWAGFAPLFGEHFVEAELKRFGYEELSAAIAWAGGEPAAGVT